MEDQKRLSLVVGEELALVREGLAALCEVSGNYEVVAKCEDGAAVVVAVEEHHPDLALLDLNLPRLFTLEAIRKIRERLVNTKLVVMSTRRDRKTVLEVLRSGAGGYVLKSGPKEHLLDAFRQVLRGSIYVSPQVEIDKVFVSRNKREPEDPLETLSAREYQVFTLLIDGIRAKEIAARLELSPKTVDTYRASLMRKLDIHDVAGLVKFAIGRSLTATA
ncbi:MAG: response regulator transcription factor [Bryobacteraceae bacterium]|nr:response regulator transcription factor [Bryobacteraceae bacterium]